MSVPPRSPNEYYEEIPSRRRTAVRVLLLVVAVVALAAAAAVAVVFERQRTYDENIERIADVFPSEADRPSAAPATSPEGDTVATPENWLLLGSDRRADGGTTGDAPDEPSWRFGAQRADTIMLVHLPADRSRVYLVSFPRDAWVPIEGHGTAKINAALSFGGAPLMVGTIERLTGVRVDHLAMLDFAGFESMTDALGGVEVTVAEPVYDSARDVRWEAGTQQLDGAAALDFVRQRYNLPGGDFDRIKRQQAFLKSLAGRVSDTDVLANPLRLNAFLEAVTSAVSVDETVSAASLRSLAIQMRSVRPDDIVFMTVPTAGLGTEGGGQSVVYIDERKARRLYKALRKDRVEQYLERTGDAANQVDTVQ